MSKSGVVAISLAAVAVVMAATGTAVAVTATQVNLVDPVTPSRVARLDANGRLTTVGVTSTYAYSSLLDVNSSDNFLTSPTTASLALTSVTLSHPSQVAGSTNVNLRIALYKAASSSKTSCVPTVYQQLYSWNLEPGDDISLNLSEPLLVRPSGSTPYCLDLYVYSITGGTYGASYYPFGSATWYVAGGTYSGPGAAASPLTAGQVKKQARSRTDR